MVSIQHLSVTSMAPERAARVLAEMTEGRAIPFGSKTMQGAWVCMWNEVANHLIEFLPDSYLMYPTESGASFRKLETPIGFNSTHFQLEVDIPLAKIQSVSTAHDCLHYFRPGRGGPLYEVWIEQQLCVEFVSDEIRQLPA